MTAFLEMRGVTKIFGSGSTSTTAVSDFSHSIDEQIPSITAIAGESGSGKSTIARLLLGFEKPTLGQVLYRGKDVQNLNGDERRTFRREIQAIFQDPFGVYNPFYKIDHLLKTPLKTFKLAKSRSDVDDQIDLALQTVGLNPNDVLGRYPHQLSGGQRQRITIARALLLRPKLILADEPVSMVDASMRATILESLLTLYREYRISFIYITHDLTTAYQIAQQLIVLYRGAIAEAGPVASVVRDPQHPYTQLLIRSIPSPDPDKPWGEDAALLADPSEHLSTQGCRFAARCPFVMPECRVTEPPRYRVNDSAVSCYLFKDRPVVTDEELMSISGCGSIQSAAD
ncbi:MAG: ABC transporter ATP-binding protein [Thermomicrobiales bacterium]